MTLDEHWVPQDPDSKEPNGFYFLGHGTEEREAGTLIYEVRESIVKGMEMSHFPTQKRVDVILQKEKDWGATPDRTIVCLPGWGETSAIFTGDFLDILMAAAEKEGSKNPCFVFPNTGGRGTFEYASRQRASVVPFRAGMEDARRLPKELLESGDLNGPVSVIGHSMGYMGAWSFAEGILEEQAKNEDSPFFLESVTGLMPATDEALGTVSPRFLKAVAKHVLPAMGCKWTGKSLSVTPEEYNALMYGDSKSPDRENFKRSVPDSGRVFLEWAALNFARRPLPKESTGVRTNILWAGQECLLPGKMGRNEFDFVRLSGADGTYNELKNFSHAIPYKMSDAQKQELLAHWTVLI